MAGLIAADAAKRSRQQGIGRNRACLVEQSTKYRADRAVERGDPCQVVGRASTREPDMEALSSIDQLHLNWCRRQALRNPAEHGVMNSFFMRNQL